MYYSEKKYSSLGATRRIMFKTCHVKTNNELKKIHGKNLFVTHYEGITCLCAHIGIPTPPRKKGYSFKVGLNSESSFPLELIADVFGILPEESTLVRIRVFTEGDFVYIVPDENEPKNVMVSKAYIAPQKNQLREEITGVVDIFAESEDVFEAVEDEYDAESFAKLLRMMPISERMKYIDKLK